TCGLGESNRRRPTEVRLVPEPGTRPYLARVRPRRPAVRDLPVAPAARRTPGDRASAPGATSRNSERTESMSELDLLAAAPTRVHRLANGLTLVVREDQIGRAH